MWITKNGKGGRFGIWMKPIKNTFTLKDVANRWGFSYGIVKRDIDKGILPAYRVGRKYFIAKDEMSEYVAKAAEKWGNRRLPIQDIMGAHPIELRFRNGFNQNGKTPCCESRQAVYCSQR